jgi:NAD(P) transhydrogenase subunit alpha
MIIATLKETSSTESRVAITPDTVSDYTKLGINVLVESGAGESAGFCDEDYKNAGASVDKKDAVCKKANILVAVQAPSKETLSKLNKSSVLVSLLPEKGAAGFYSAATKQVLSVFASEYIPRITRAQSMDVLSSQSNVAGYKAVIDAVSELSRVVPMMVTAAGTIRPAKALILGAGVAGLQAIATAKRLGAIVSAFDVRAAAKEQVESLGATFIEVESTTDAETSGGYAKEMDEDYKRRQQELIAKTISEQDIVISTALIPGKPAPLLIPESMVKNMKKGAVICDLATVSGGNCEVSEKNKVVKKHGVTIIGYSNTPARVAEDTSKLFARNIYNFVSLLINKEDQSLNINFDDEIIHSSLITHDGTITHPNYKD